MYLLIELVGTMAFACSGAVVAMKKQLDFFGILVLGVITSVGGGLIRDVLLGKVPPTLFFRPIYPTTAFFAIVVLFILFKSNRVSLEFCHSHHFDFVVNLIDAIGLGVFTAAGVETVMEAGHGDHRFMVIALGVVTGVGGGLLRDVLAGQTPFIFRKHFYACASLLGAVSYYWMIQLAVGRTTALILSTVLVSVVRVLARKYHWGLPRVDYSWPDHRPERKK